MTGIKVAWVRASNIPTAAVSGDGFKGHRWARSTTRMATGVGNSKKTSTRVTMFHYFHYVLPGTQINKSTGQNFLLTNQLPNQVTDELKKLIGLFTEQKINQPNTRRSHKLTTKLPNLLTRELTIKTTKWIKQSRDWPVPEWHGVMRQNNRNLNHDTLKTSRIANQNTFPMEDTHIKLIQYVVTFIRFLIV